MKWGVRRTPEQLGRRTFKKGMKVYRVTAGKEDLTKGATFVSYLPPDRDYYRGGSGAQFIRGMAGKSAYDAVYEHELTLKEDLNVPSRQTVKDVYAKLSKTPKIKNEIAQFLAASRLGQNTYFMNRRISELKTTKDKSDYEKKLLDRAKSLTKEAKKYMDDMTPDEAFMIYSSAVNGAPNFKNAAIAELKKQGYNAMVDEASVGGVGRNREGVDPLLIFDSTSSLEEKSNGGRKVGFFEGLGANMRYENWYSTANSMWNRNKEW